ncbi:MAG: class I SAM-dependent rRNA methyltransferase [Saprospiraceae bacterium]|nr:class I SAM-dependent rRNA methyltransferase [Saprospiraceae bacterium]
MKKIFLKKGKEEAVRRQHPWIFSGAVAHTEGVLSDGDLVEVYDAKKQFLAVGYYNDGSIVVRVLSFELCTIDTAFWEQKISNAFRYRQRLNLTDSKSTNCYRLIHAEGDGLAGLIVDIYDSVAVIQCHSIGMHRQIEPIQAGLKKIFGHKLKAIYDKSAETLPPQYVAQNQIKNDYLWGAAEVPLCVSENDNAFAIDWVTGQKTGFFLDQRDNRALLNRYAEGKSVLNAFCYSGGFSIYALKAGAKSVHSIDISPKAIDLTLKNVELNCPFTGEHTAAAVDVMAFLKENNRIYDVMIVDPPAFAKSIAKRHNAVQAYKRLNAMALRQITEGGILFTFSCSQVVDNQLFYDTIVAAAIEAKRQVRVMHRLTQPADHPVNIFHPEGSYLKGLVLYVE